MKTEQQKFAEQSNGNVMSSETRPSGPHDPNIGKVATSEAKAGYNPLDEMFKGNKALLNYSAELDVLSRPLIKWLNDNFHPHAKIIISTSNAEVVEGVAITGTITDYIKD